MMKTNVQAAVRELTNRYKNESLGRGAIMFHIGTVTKLIVLDDGTVVKKLRDRVTVTPSFKYGGIKLEYNEVSNVYVVEEVFPFQAGCWLAGTITQREKDGQVNEKFRPLIQEWTHINDEGVLANEKINAESRQYKIAQMHKTGYKYASVELESSKPSPVPVHTLVAAMFEKYNDTDYVQVVNHMNALKVDNSIDNLEWVTVKLNKIHGNYVNGLCNTAIAKAQETGIEPKERFFKQIMYMTRDTCNTCTYFCLNDRVPAEMSTNLFQSEIDKKFSK